MIRKRLKYKFNPDTLSFEVESVALLSRLKKYFLTLISLIATAVIWVFVYSLFFDTPKSKLLEEKNRSIKAQYSTLLFNLDNLNSNLNDIADRDNEIYRAVFGEDIIPNSIREAGMGGINRYIDLENLGLSDPSYLVNVYKYTDLLQKKAYIQSKSLDRIAFLTADKSNMQSSMPLSPPVQLNKVRFSSSMGYRFHPVHGIRKLHEGIDLSGPIGTPIMATGSGIVTRSDFSSGYGNLVEIDHGYGYTTRYGHLSEIKAQSGQRVIRGQLIGLMGSTGTSTSSHLHYEVRLKGVPQNPLNYFENSYDSESEDLIPVDNITLEDEN